ncbi:hypothetical protein VNO78_12464 [Psophocarpus tetragonolobus]|uniref:Lipoxygenase domain-containing protein n=1 Tax=Psophocarpus tetragonolobus TaxID=3891 RepID=A0AAN9SQT4_PSOTE
MKPKIYGPPESAITKEVTESHIGYGIIEKKLLHPHLRFTMAVNALAHEILINAYGIIERSFSPHTYSMELRLVAYDQIWRFDVQALPNDLI